MRAGKLFKRNCQLVSATPDFLSVHRGEPQLQSFQLRGATAVRTQRSHFHFARLGSPFRRVAVDSLLQPSYRLQSSFETRAPITP
jgi:hypothetical protein